MQLMKGEKKFEDLKNNEDFKTIVKTKKKININEII